MNTVWGQFVDRLVALLPDVWPQVTVYDGPVSDKTFPRDYVTVGFVDGEDVAGSFEPTPQLGHLEEEVGSVRSELVCQTGDDALTAMRVRAFGYVDQLKAAIAADRTLGASDVVTVDLSADVLPVRNTEGAAVRIALTLTYTARGV